MVKVIFHTLRTLKTERIRSQRERILSFKRSSHYEKGRNCRESLLDTVVSFDVRKFYINLATPLCTIASDKRQS